LSAKGESTHLGVRVLAKDVAFGGDDQGQRALREVLLLREDCRAHTEVDYCFGRITVLELGDVGLDARNRLECA
jgi:hypothetical protein